MNYQEIYNFSCELCKIADQISQKYFRLSDPKLLQEIAKEDDSVVTFADREIEKQIREAIIDKFPTHGIIGEEYGNHQLDAENIWIIDPIDGTSSFIIGRPIFGNLIAFAQKQQNLTTANKISLKSGINNNSQEVILDNYQVILGIINQPITKERWIGCETQFGEQLRGSWFNGKKITTRQCSNIANAVMSSTSPVFFQGDDAKIFEKLCKLTKYQKNGGVIYGGDCYSYGCLAMGFIDIIIEPQLKIYDFACHIPLIKNAGGVISDWQGNELSLGNNARLLACSSIELHNEIIDLIKNYSKI